MDSRLRDGVRAALPLALAPLLFGASFGVLAVDAGLGRLGAIVMSATTFAGSAQFAAASTLESGGWSAAAIVAAALLNARYVPQSMAVASIFPGSRKRRFIESQLPDRGRQPSNYDLALDHGRPPRGRSRGPRAGSPPDVLALLAPYLERRARR